MATERLNFTFAGCGFMGIYHVGVASCLKEYAPTLISDKICGASAGAIVACLLLCDAPLGECTSWTLNLATKARRRSLGPMHPSFNITQYLKEGLDEILPANAHAICSGRLHISMTRVKDGKNVVVNEFSSREELLQGLLCSAFIPFWSGLIPPLFRNERHVDGALSDNLPKIDINTITVSPFAGKSDICPQDDTLNILHFFVSNTSIQLSAQNLYRMSRIMFPPHPEKLSEICRRGFDDTLSYLREHNLVNCSRHLEVRSVLSRRTESICCDMDELDSEKDCVDDSCESCAKNRSSNQGLSPAVISALDEAIELVNSGYYVYIRNTKPYRTLSVMCSPFYLPFDLMVHTLIRLLKWLPSLHHDMKWLTETILWYAKLFSGKVITKGRHTYSAKFICQLAITEVQHTDITSDMVLTSQTHIHDSRIGFGLGLTSDDTLELVHDLRQKFLEEQMPDTLAVDTHSVLGSIHTSVTMDRQDDNFYSKSSSRGNSRANSRPVSRPSSRAVSRAVSRAASRRSSVTENYVHGSEDSSQYIDTFDQCIHVADKRNALLAYFYKDEYGQLQTTEIFKMEDGSQETMSSHSTSLSSLVSGDLQRSGSARFSIANDIDDDVAAMAPHIVPEVQAGNGKSNMTSPMDVQ